MASRPFDVTLMAGIFLALGVGGLVGGGALGLRILADSTAGAPPLGPVAIIVVLALVDLVVASGLRRMKLWAWYLGIVNVLMGVPIFDVAISFYSFPLGVTLIVVDLVLLILVFRGRQHFHGSLKQAER
ncbi:MAG: hypothetical protein ACE5KH_03260 [Candidatus Geothermarchaeales archaeon]